MYFHKIYSFNFRHILLHVPFFTHFVIANPNLLIHSFYSCEPSIFCVSLVVFDLRPHNYMAHIYMAILRYACVDGFEATGNLWQAYHNIRIGTSYAEHHYGFAYVWPNNSCGCIFYRIQGIRPTFPWYAVHGEISIGTYFWIWKIRNCLNQLMKWNARTTWVWTCFGFLRFGAKITWEGTSLSMNK